MGEMLDTSHAMMGTFLTGMGVVATAHQSKASFAQVVHLIIQTSAKRYVEMERTQVTINVMIQICSMEMVAVRLVELKLAGHAIIQLWEAETIAMRSVEMPSIQVTIPAMTVTSTTEMVVTPCVRLRSVGTAIFPLLQDVRQIQ